MPKWSPDGRTLAVKMTDPDTEEDKRRKKERDDVFVHHEREKFDRLTVVDVPNDPFGSASVEPVEPRTVLEGDWHLWEYAWSPDGTRFAVTVARHTGFNETFDGVRAGLVSADGGEITLIGGEEGQYRSPGSLAWSPDGKRLAFLAAPDLKRDAGEAIFLADAGDPATVTMRFYDNEGSVLSIGWPLADRLMMYREVSVYTTIWSIAADGDGAPEKLIGGTLGERGTAGYGFDLAGISQALDRSCERFAFSWSSATEPGEVWAGEVGGEARKLTSFNAELATRAIGRTELVRWKSDELEIEGLLIYPVGYEEGKRYPTILHIHGGPSWAWDDHFYANWHDWGQFLAGNGYAVLMPNPRGSTGRGWEFHIANYNDWMGGDYLDSQRGLDMLIERGIADPDRLGIGGWSYGGLTTAWALTQTDRFKAAVLGAGVTNRVSMQGTTDIVRWHGSWQSVEFAEGTDEYWHRSAMRYIGQVKTPTLIPHGEKDDRVPVSQGWEYYNALRMMGVPTKMVVYPREPHGLGERNHQRDLMERVLAWFDEYVK
jgi:dipeptidyl aminopeptidase/acylaminoacyl peptidase